MSYEVNVAGEKETHIAGEKERESIYSVYQSM